MVEAPASPTASPSHSENIVDRLAAFIRRFVFLKEPSLYRLLALWVIHTYLIEEFEYTGYLFAYSPEPGSGKSKLLEVLDVLVRNSSGLLISPSESVVFRTATNRTQLLDEIDTWTNREQLRGVLNAGYQRSGKIPRMGEKVEKKGGAKDYQVQYFPVFAPRAMSGIGMNSLPPATRTRTFGIAMVRQLQTERREKFRPRKLKTDIEKIVGDLKSWAAANKAAIIARYDSEFRYLEKFEDRTVDMSEPLAAILEVGYQDSTELNHARLSLLDAIAATREEQTEPIPEHHILAALMSATQASEFFGGRPLIGTASELAELCGKSGVKSTEYDVSAVLRGYGFKSKSIRMEDGSKKRYSLSRGALEEISSRYLGGKETEALDAGATQPTTSEVIEMAGT
jgi:hypothetical protein